MILKTMSGIDIHQLKVKLSDDLSWRDVNDEMVALNLKTGEYYTFNDVGRGIWLALTDDKSPSEIVEMVVTKYDTKRAAAESDVADFVGGLLDKGVLIDCGNQEEGEAK